MTRLLVPSLAVADRKDYRFHATRDGSGPWIFSCDVERRVARRVSVGPARCTYLAASAEVKARKADGTVYPLPRLVLTRCARHLSFMPGRRSLVVLRGGLRHKDLWLIDLDTGAEHQLTELPPDFTVRDFDISPDGRELVLEQEQQQSDIVLLEIPRR